MKCLLVVKGLCSNIAGVNNRKTKDNNINIPVPTVSDQFIL